MSIVISDRDRASNPYLDRIKLVQDNIINQDVDAIVTFIPQNLEYRGAVNKSLLRSAGTKLDNFVLENIIQPKPGDIYPVPGFNLPCKDIFFCVVPVWRDDFDRHDKYILNACRRSLEMAKAMDLKSLAFPPLASGKRGYPKARAARLILQGIQDRLDDSIEEVRIACLAGETIEIFRERLESIGWKGTVRSNSSSFL